MSLESHYGMPLPSECEKAIIMPAVDAPAPPDHSLIQDPAHVQAIEKVFGSGGEKEPSPGTTVFGLWTAAMFLHDLAVDTFSKPAGEFEEEELLRRKKEKPST